MLLCKIKKFNHKIHPFHIYKVYYTTLYYFLQQRNMIYKQKHYQSQQTPNIKLIKVHT